MFQLSTVQKGDISDSTEIIFGASIIRGYNKYVALLSKEKLKQKKKKGLVLDLFFLQLCVCEYCCNEDDNHNNYRNDWVEIVVGVIRLF